MIVIYDHNDSGQSYETTTVTNLASARNINYEHSIVIYDRKKHYKLKRNLPLYETFIVQATGQKFLKLLWQNLKV
jgi:hypothetical protein